MSELPQSDPGRRDRGGVFDPETLDKTVIAIPLLRQLREEEQQQQRPPERHHVVLDLNFGCRESRDAGRDRARRLVTRAVERAGGGEDQGVDEQKSSYSQQYLFAALGREAIQELVRRRGRSRQPCGRDHRR